MKAAVFVMGALAALALAQPAGAEVVDIEWSPQQRFERRIAVAPGGFAEVCGKLAQGTAVSWWFDAGQRLDFNIHYHQGKAVHYPVKRSGVKRADGRLHARLDQDYCWMWTNKSSQAAALTLRLAR